MNMGIKASSGNKLPNYSVGNALRGVPSGRRTVFFCLRNATEGVPYSSNTNIYNNTNNTHVPNSVNFSLTSPDKCRLLCLPVRFHRDERGTISIITVFAFIFLAMLLGMVVNVGYQVDGKIRMQNAADAVAYSGGVVLSRGMNDLAMTNHLLCDTFALTAFLREARDRNSEKFVPDILKAWSTVAPVFNSTGFPKFQQLGTAILQKVPLEAQLVTTYSQWAAALSQAVLPLMEEILAEELIPKYQRAVVLTFPDIAQSAAMEIARSNGNLKLGRGPMYGALWRADISSTTKLVGGDNEAWDLSLPVVDPTLDPNPRYLSSARDQRKKRAQQYLNQWNDKSLRGFENWAKMCQFHNLWRSFTCGYLTQLLEKEYPNANLPFQIRTQPSEMGIVNPYLQQHFMFVGVVYWPKLPELLPGLFHNPMENDSIAFAQTCVFLPTQRLVWEWSVPYVLPVDFGGVPGESPPLPGDTVTQPTRGAGAGHWIITRQSVPTEWSLMSQHWTCQLVPANAINLAAILQTIPSLPAFNGVNLTPPNLGGVDAVEIQRVNTH
jgi:hypothetical protein